MIHVVGLGPAELNRVSGPVREVLLDPARSLIVRTIQHPAAAELAELRQLTSCDDLYEASGSFPDVYSAIVERIVSAAANGPVVYAVPGSPLVGEFAVRELLSRGEEVELIPGESFVDAILTHVGYDPFDRGLQILNGHELPDPLILDKPTIIGHLDRPEVLADVAARVSRVLAEEATVTVVVDAGGATVHTATTPADRVDHALAGLRTSMFIDAEPGGLVGAIRAMRRLRIECPWDREQTHQSLAKNLIEETHELIEAIARLPENGEPDWVAYAGVEDELGDVLLLVLFHEVIARQDGAFDIDDVAEVLRLKLVRRHPHVFGDVEVDSAEDVKRNWDRIKSEERGGVEPESVLDGVPTGMPAMQRASKIQNRAAKVGFDWSEAGEVMEKVVEEVAELGEALAGQGDVEHEVGDLLFSVVNLTRHLGIDTEMALSRATNRFDTRFRAMEAEGPLDGLDLDALNERWERAKSAG